MIKAVIFDLNGIFYQSALLSKRMEKDFGVENDKFLPRLKTIMEETRKPGAKPAFHHWQKALEEWHLNITEKDFWNYWFGGEKASARMFDFAQGLRQRGIKTFILSNNFKERADHYSRNDFVSTCFDKVYYSHQTGFVKPDSMAWEHLLRDNNLKPEECLYFDDQEKNVAAAQKIGIKSFLFTNEEELERVVNEYLNK